MRVIESLVKRGSWDFDVFFGLDYYVIKFKYKNWILGYLNSSFIY